MAFKLKNKQIKKIIGELRGASKLHAGQASKIDKMVSALPLKKSSALRKISAACKAAAKRKFKVYPSAYANMWAAKTQRQGKC